MGKEVELKFKVDDFRPIRRKLRSMKAKLIWAGNEKSWFFDSKGSMLQKHGIVLRVRKVNSGKFLLLGSIILKEKKRIEHGTKVAHRYWVAVNNPNMVSAIFEHLGFKRRLSYSKQREHWELPQMYVELDRLRPGMHFVEIEASRRKIKSLAKNLGLDFSKSTPDTYVKLLTDAKK